MGRRIFFTPDGGESGLFISDGTNAGTFKIDTGAVKTLSQAIELTAAGGRLFFSANDPAHGVEPWATDVIQTNFGEIAGTIFNDYDRDGARDAGEPALRGVTVFLDADNDGVLDSGEVSARSSSTGRYTFSNLAAGTYFVREIPPATRAPTTATIFRVALAQDQRTVRYFGNTGGTISGYVYHDANFNMVRDAGEQGIAGAHLFLDLDGDGVWDEGENVVRTRADGRYTMIDVPAGTFKLRLFTIPGYHFSTSPARRVTIPAGGSLRRDFGQIPDA